MPFHSRILAAAALIALAGSAGAAQAPARLHTAPGPVAATAAPDSAHIAATLAAATDLINSGRVREAMRSLHSVAAEQKSAGDYPAEALRRLASLQYGAGQEFAAAGTLDELAEAAHQFGDPTTELRALFDAALVYQELKMNDRVPERVQQVNRLLKSPAISEKLRAEISARMARS